MAQIVVFGADSPVGEMLVEALAVAGHPRRAVLPVGAADLDDPLPANPAAACADGRVPGAAERLQALASQGIPALGVGGAGEEDWPLVLSSEDLINAAQLRLASPEWVLLSLLLRPLQGAFGVTSVAATVLRPASDRGTSALEILGQQTAAVLNFRDPPSGVYPQRIAFNALPAAAGDDPEMLSTVLWQGDGPVVQLQAWDVPVFVGLSMSLSLTLEQASTAADVSALLAAIPGINLHEGVDDLPSPVTLMAAEGTMVLHGIRVVGRQVQMAVVADNLGFGAAQPAARLLRRLVGQKF